MKIIVVGGGKVGEFLCQELSDEENDIILIEKDPKTLHRVFSSNDIQAVEGNGASLEVLKEVGVKETDVFISVTESDETNIISAMIAKKLGARYTIARVRNPEYNSDREFVRETLGIYAMINPEEEAASLIYRSIKYPKALNVEEFADAKVNIVELIIRRGSPMENMSLKSFKHRYPQLLICIVERDEESFIPSGDTVLESEDRIHVTGAHRSLTDLYKIIGDDLKPLQNVMIIGGGTIAYYLTSKLLKAGKHVKIIEADEKRANELAASFEEAVVIHADGTDESILEEEGIDQTDVCVALTGIDEENAILSMVAKSKGAVKTVTKINRTAMLRLIDRFDLDTIITPKRVIADKIIRFVRSLANTNGSTIENMHKLANRSVESIQFKVSEHFSGLRTPLSDLQIKSGILIAIIIRNHQIIYPTGSDQIRAGDRVIIITKRKNLNDLEDILVPS